MLPLPSALPNLIVSFAPLFSKPQALRSTDLESDPVELLEYFVSRWQVEVTF